MFRPVFLYLLRVLIVVYPRKNMPLMRYLTVLLLLFTNGLLDAQPLPDIVNETPSWFTKSSDASDGFIDGLGSGASLHEAFALALNNLAESLQADVQTSGETINTRVSSQKVGPCRIENLTTIDTATITFELALRVTCSVDEEQWNLELHMTENQTDGLSVQTSRTGTLTSLELMDAMMDAKTQIRWAIQPSSENGMHVIRVRNPVQE